VKKKTKKTVGKKNAAKKKVFRGGDEEVILEGEIVQKPRIEHAL
jgi:hypothetical protein